MSVRPAEIVRVAQEQCALDREALHGTKNACDAVTREMRAHQDEDAVESALQAEEKYYQSWQRILERQIKLDDENLQKVNTMYNLFKPPPRRQPQQPQQPPQQRQQRPPQHPYQYQQPPQYHYPSQRPQQHHQSMYV